MTTADTLNTFLAALDAHPLLERLFFASAELAVLAALVALAIAGLRIRSPRACAMLWLIVLAKPVVTLTFGAVVPVLRLAPPDPIVAAAPLPEAPPIRSEAMPKMSAPELLPAPLPATPVKPTATAIPVRPPINWGALAPRILASLWLAGVVALLGSTLLDRIRLRRFLARTAPPSAHASAALTEGAASLQLRTVPPLRMTTELESPAVVGWFRSTIVIPQWLNAPENETALAWALRHELTHLKHRDPIANALRRLAQILFFFHPVTWWASRRWEAAVELACDRAVVRTDDDVTAYAEQLYAILVQARQQRQRTMATGLFATRTQINTRIAALLGNSLNTPARLGVAAAATLTLFAGTVFAVGGAIADREEVKEETAAEETEQPLPQPQDTALQATCESLLEGEAGAIVVLNADTGAVLAMASAPFGTMKEVIEGQKASGNASQIRPAYTRAYQEQYPPGSIFKILLAAAALEEGIITPDTTHYCGGSYRINGGGRAWHCWQRRGHDRINVTDALVYSCDVFFYNVGLSLGVDKINKWAGKFGLGISTGIDLPREINGLIPSQEWKKQIFADKTVSEQKWYPGDTVNLSIGQGSAAITPLQNAVMMAAIVNGGFRVAPRMAPEKLADRSERMLSDATLEILHAALRKTVEKAPPDYPAGTGWRAGIDGVQVLGKTGSAQIMSAEQQSKYASDEEIPYEMRDHAWFVAGVTDREPKISVSVFLEHGGTGAAEVARAVIAKAYGIETSDHEKTVVIDGKTVTLFKAEDAGQEPTTTRSRRSSLEKSTGPAVKERPYMVHLLSGQSQPADVVEEDESFYLLTYDSYTFKIRKTLVREVVKVVEDDKGKGAEVLPARTLNFPDDRSLGTIYLSNPIDYDTAPSNALLMYRFDAWKKLGEARGRVEIPAGKIVRLSATVAWTDEAFAALPANGIQHLNLSSDAFSPAGMPHHTVWRGLMALGFDGAAFPASELPYLATLENVRWLDLRGANLDSHALEFVTGLTQLRGLNLAEVNLAGIEASPLKGFANLGQLQLLDLSGTGVNGASLREISSSTELVSLSLERCPVTNGDLDALAGLANLKTLSLERTGITDGYKTALGKLPNITSLKVDYTDTPDAEHRATALGGRIIAEDGQPASGVYVTLGTEGPDHFSHGRTNANGRWQVLVQTGWTRAAVLLSGGGHMNETAPRILSEAEVAQLREGTLETTAKPGTSLSGVVLDPEGNPVANALILRDEREKPRETSHEGVYTDNEGRFIIEHLDDTQELALAVLSDGHAPFALHVPPGREKAPVIVKLGEAFVFHGEVRDAKEEPVEGVIVKATSWRPGTDYAPMQDEKRPRVSHMHRLVEEARSDAEGKFTISNLPSYGKVQFTLRRAEYFAARLNAEPPFDDDAIVYVVPEAPFRGRVVDADTGSPVTDYEVEFDVSAEDERFYWRQKGQPKVIRDVATGKFSADLNYTLEAATSPDFAARVTAEGYTRQESTIVTADRLGEVITIKLRRLDVSQIDTLAPDTGE